MNKIKLVKVILNVKWLSNNIKIKMNRIVFMCSPEENILTWKY